MQLCQKLSALGALALVLAIVSTPRAHAAGPDISVIELVEDVPRGSPLKFDRRIRQNSIASSVSSVALKCEANYPVMWSLNSLEQEDVFSTQSERFVKTPIKMNFNDSSSHTYSMTVKLHINRLTNIEEKKFICHESAYRQGHQPMEPVRVASVAFKWDDSLKTYIVSPSATIESEMVPPATMVADGEGGFVTGRDESESDFSMFSDYSSSHTKFYCCIKPGAHLDKSGSGIGHYSVPCSQPLLCLTRNYAETESNWKYAPSDNSKGRCSYLSWRKEKDGSDDYLPSIHVCRLAHYGYFHNTEKQERAFNIFPTNRTFFNLEYKSLLDNTQTQAWTNVQGQVSNSSVLYVGDLLEFRCMASPYVYASGIIWEKEFANGTVEFLRGNVSIGNWASNEIIQLKTGLEDVLLVRVSCHAPLWNSAAWATKSLALKIEPSSVPLSTTGESFVPENVTFYSYQEALLECDFNGQPPPKIHWNSTSDVYRLAENGTTAAVSLKYRHHDSPDFPEVEFTCFASNVLGNATKVFNIQALGSMPPSMTNAAREAVVMDVGEVNRAINCSVIDGVPAPEFHWFRHGINVTQDSEVEGANYKVQMGGDGTGVLWSLLVFRKVRFEDEAEYMCKAKNFRGLVSKEFSVRVRGDHAPSSIQSTVIALLVLVIVLICLVVAIIAFLWITKTRNPTTGAPRAEFMKSDGTNSTVIFSKFPDY